MPVSPYGGRFDLRPWWSVPLCQSPLPHFFLVMMAKLFLISSSSWWAKLLITGNTPLNFCFCQSLEVGSIVNVDKSVFWFTFWKLNIYWFWKLNIYWFCVRKLILTNFRLLWCKLNTHNTNKINFLRCIYSLH